MLKIDKNSRHSAEKLIDWISQLEEIEKRSTELKNKILQDLDNSLTKISDSAKYETDVTYEKIENFYFHLQMPMFSWYLECDKSTAEKILERIEINQSNNMNNIFLVRYGKKYIYNLNKEYTITLKLKNEKNIKHIKIEQIKIDSIIKYKILIDKHLDKYFNSLLELINFFRLNSLYDSHNVLEMSYRDAIPTPVYSALANTDYEGLFHYIIFIYILKLNFHIDIKKKGKSNDELKLVKFSCYFIVKEMNDKECKLYNKDGLLGSARIKHLDRI